MKPSRTSQQNERSMLFILKHRHGLPQMPVPEVISALEGIAGLEDDPSMNNIQKIRRVVCALAKDEWNDISRNQDCSSKAQA